MRTPIALALSLSAALLATACGKDAQAPPPPEDAMPATATFDDRALGVFFAAPDADFALLTGEAARAVHPEAVAVLDKGAKCRGFVTVAPLGGRTLAAAAAAAKAGLGFAEPRVVQDEELLYCSKTGWRLEVWGQTAAGEPVARRLSFLVDLFY